MPECVPRNSRMVADHQGGELPPLRAEDRAGSMLLCRMRHFDAGANKNRVS
jgi:hypothetical protein